MAISESKTGSRGPVHKIPSDLRNALRAEAITLAAWADLTPLARNEWICWIITAKQADAIMTAHVFNATLDPTYPATLSKPTITGILRGELHYDGVVITDDMQMGAIRELYGFETAIQKTLEAGVDIIAIANNLVYEEDAAARTFALIKQLVTNGIIPEARIDQSYQRIQQLKSKLAKPLP